MKREAENTAAYLAFAKARAGLIDEWVLQGWPIEDIATALSIDGFQVSLISRRNARSPAAVPSDAGMS